MLFRSRNGYPVAVVNNIINKHKAKPHNNPKICNDKYVCLDFYNDSSYLIGQCFRRNGYKTAFRTNSKIINKLKLKSKTHTYDRLNQSGVYKISCNNCDNVYIGKTERNFSSRFKEHLKCNTSNVYKHLKDLNHNINEDNLSILHVSNDKHMIKILEKFEITNSVSKSEKLLNIQLDIESASNILIDKCCNM